MKSCISKYVFGTNQSCVYSLCYFLVFSKLWFSNHSVFTVRNVVPFRHVTLILHTCDKKLLIFTLRAICSLQQVVLKKGILLLSL